MNLKSLEEFRSALVASGLIKAAELDDASAAASAPPAAASAAEATSLVVGDYTLLGLLGSGGMGQVYKASHRVMERIVAIKLLPAALTKDEDSIKRFRQEVRAAARLAHPNIVHAYDAGQARGVWYLVMEYVEGHDLAEVVHRRGPLGIAAAVDYTLQAARGLAYAHGEGIIHRDIKPANLLLDKHGTIKILDMGLARIDAAKSSGDHQLTMTGAVMGTVDFMPPEQAANTRAADARSDIYSLGCTLHRLLTNTSVYPGETIVEKLMAHMNAPIPSLRAFRPDAPAELERIFTKCLAKDPAHRFQATTELVAALEALIAAGLPAASFKNDESLDTTHLSHRAGEASGVETTGWHRPDNPTSPLPSTEANRDRSGVVTTPVGASPSASRGNHRRRQMAFAMGATAAVVLMLSGIWLSSRGTFDREPTRIESAEGESLVLAASRPIPTIAPPSPSGSSSGSNIEAAVVPRVDVAFEAWLYSIQELSDVRKVLEVEKKLVELNPDYDDSPSPTIDRNIVVGVRINAEHITDLRPLRAYKSLRTLFCSPYFGKQSRLSDLSPLAGLPLTSINCSRTAVADLTPLKGMQLTTLTCDRTNVESLEPLRGMPLEYLSCSETKVSDLSPLVGMPLVNAMFLSTPVRDLTPLDGCTTLEGINFHDTRVSAIDRNAFQAKHPNCKLDWFGAAVRPKPTASATASPTGSPSPGAASR